MTDRPTGGAPALQTRLHNLERLTRQMQARHDRERFEVAALREVARTARRLRLAIAVIEHLPTKEHVDWLEASLEQLDRALGQLDDVEEGLGASSASPDGAGPVVVDRVGH